LKKTGILNRDLSQVIASMGHTDMLVVADAGLPVPAGVQRIDLAVRGGLPGFLETVEAISGELQVERIIVAEETGTVSPQIHAGLTEILHGAEVETVSHAQFKNLTKGAIAVVRTGEFTPYANVILVSGVVF
jgi:D-ribose pyranase